MDITPHTPDQSAEIIALFENTFAASEGAAEGRLIGQLVSDMLSTVKEPDRIVLCARTGTTLIGCIILTRMTYADDSRTVFILSPVAVAPDHQRIGIGQRLLRQGLTHLRAAGVDVVLTYGDPAYYARVGFHQITQELAQAPLPLSHPQGWLGQSLTDAPLTALRGRAICVPALNDPAYW